MVLLPQLPLILKLPIHSLISRDSYTGTHHHPSWTHWLYTTRTVRVCSQRWLQRTTEGAFPGNTRSADRARTMSGLCMRFQCSESLGVDIHLHLMTPGRHDDHHAWREASHYRRHQYRMTYTITILPVWPLARCHIHVHFGNLTMNPHFSS